MISITDPAFFFVGASESYNTFVGVLILRAAALFFVVCPLFGECLGSSVDFCILSYL